MKHLLSMTACLSTLLLFSAALPSQASTLSFTSNLTQGDITTGLPAGLAAPVTVLMGDFSTFTVTGAPSGNGVYTTLFLPLNYTPNTLTIMGSIPSLPGLAASSTLLTINFTAAGLTANTTGSGSTAFVLNFPTNVSSIVVSPTLLADLGLSSASFLLTAFADTGAAQGNTPDNFTSHNPSLTLSSAVPEPSVFLMTGLGLVLTAFVARKKFGASRTVR